VSKYVDCRGHTHCSSSIKHVDCNAYRGHTVIHTTIYVCSTTIMTPTNDILSTYILHATIMLHSMIGTMLVVYVYNDCSVYVYYM
jgi:hypothetical protein